jgi:hypothetical protein
VLWGNVTQTVINECIDAILEPSVSPNPLTYTYTLLSGATKVSMIDTFIETSPLAPQGASCFQYYNVFFDELGNDISSSIPSFMSISG